jgi:hypothetical protein
MAQGGVGHINSLDQLDVFTRTGIVRETQDRTRISTTTTTTASGGGGHVHGGQGRIDPIHVTTETTARSQHSVHLFILEKDGDELHLELPDPGFGVRGGHAVTVVFAGARNSGRGHAMALVNHSTNKTRVYQERGIWLVRRPPRPLMWAMVAAFPLISMVAFTLITGTGGLRPALYGLVAAAAGIAFLWFRRDALAKDVVRRVSERAAQAAAEG